MKQDSTKTKSNLKENINPKTLAIAVENIKEGKEGTVIINCNNTSTKEKIKEKVQNELGTQYKVTDGTQKNPKVIVCGVEDEVLEADDKSIAEMVTKQNDIELKGGENLQVHAKYKQKNKINKGNIIMTVTPEIKNKMCQLGKLNIGWRRCMVQEYFNVVRCYKCARYGHISVNCKNDITCFKCAGPHKSSNCDAESPKCINCLETNNRLKKALNVNHTVTDNECPCYKRIRELEEKKTRNI